MNRLLLYRPLPLKTEQAFFQNLNLDRLLLISPLRQSQDNQSTLNV